MSVLLAMCCFDTIENKRTDLTRQTIQSLHRTVDFSKHRLIVIDNASCEATKELLLDLQHEMWFEIITCEENIGTAKGINLAIKKRLPGQAVIKIDNDVVIKQAGWVDLMEEAILRESAIGVIGLKRVDLDQSPNLPDDHWAKSHLFMVSQVKGQRWIVCEQSNDIIGTCVMMSSDLLDKINALVQLPAGYGFDDNLLCVRSMIAGFVNCFLPHVEVEHIDNTGSTEYVAWKSKVAGEQMEEFNRVRKEYFAGTRNIFQPFE